MGNIAFILYIKRICQLQDTLYTLNILDTLDTNRHNSVGAWHLINNKDFLLDILGHRLYLCQVF